VEPLKGTPGSGWMERLPRDHFRESWPPEVVARMKALRDKALAELADDAAARKSFLYWTWEFDAFVEYAGMVEKVMSRGPGVAQSADTSGAAADEDAAARFRGGSAEVNQIQIANVRRQDCPVDGQS
jgi:hypothetical protein